MLSHIASVTTFFIWDNLDLPEINIFIALKSSELQNKQVEADILLGFYLANDCKER